MSTACFAKCLLERPAGQQKDQKVPKNKLEQVFLVQYNAELLFHKRHIAESARSKWRNLPISQPESKQKQKTAAQEPENAAASQKC